MKTIEVKNLCKTFEKAGRRFGSKAPENVVALDGLSFSAKSAEVFGLLGPNGAGKTTTVKILSTLLLPTSCDKAMVLGHDVTIDMDKIRPRIGTVFGGERGLYWRLSGRANLEYFAALYKLNPQKASQDIDTQLKLVGLEDRADYRVETYSRGMKQRLHLARGLLHDPQVLFLDEPTNGLDPVGAREIRQLIKQMRSEGRTIFLTTHNMYEADELCDRVAIIDHGCLLHLGDPSSLKELVTDRHILELSVGKLKLQTIERLRAQAGVRFVNVKDNQDEGNLLQIHYDYGASILQETIANLNGVSVESFVSREPTLEDAYIQLMTLTNAKEPVES